MCLSVCMLKFLISWYHILSGPLLAVTALVRGFISDRTFSWNPPPTLDLTNVEPDIAYCVIIHNITCGRNDFLISDCSRTDPFYIYEDIHPGHVYSILVIPRSNVDRALNGTPLFIEGTCSSLLLCTCTIRYHMALP